MALARTILSFGGGGRGAGTFTSSFRNIMPSALRNAAVGGSRNINTTNQNINGFIRQTQSSRNTTSVNRLSRILDIIRKVLCGIMIVVAIINIIIRVFDKGKQKPKLTSYGAAVQQTTNVGWFRTFLSTFDIILFVDKAGALLSKSDKVKIAEKAYHNKWIESNNGPLPLGLSQSDIKQKLLNGELRTRTSIIISAEPTRVDGPAAYPFDPANPDAGGQCHLDINDTIGRDFQNKTVISWASDARDGLLLNNADIGIVTASEDSWARFFGNGGGPSSKVCQSCDTKPCGNIFLQAHHPLDICLGRAQGIAVGSDCETFMCKDYHYKIKIKMSKTPKYFSKMSLEDMADFMIHHIHDDSKQPIVWPPNGKKIEFYYDDTHYDVRWEQNFPSDNPFPDSRSGNDGQNASISAGDSILNYTWRGGMGDDLGQMGLCCDPYTDQDTLAKIKNMGPPDGNKISIQRAGDSSPIEEYAVSIASENEIHVIKGPNCSDGLVAANQTQNSSNQALLWSVPMIAPSHRTVEVRKFDSSSGFTRARNTADYKNVRNFITQLANKNNEVNDSLEPDKAARIPGGKFYLPVHEEIKGTVTRNRQFGTRVRGQWNYYESIYEGEEEWWILKNHIDNDFAVMYSQLEKTCKCAGQALYGADTSNQTIQNEPGFVVGAEYEIMVERYERAVCDRGKGAPEDGDSDTTGWTKVDNAGTFVINCGDDNASPGNGVVDISYGYHAVGGYVNRQ